MKIKLTEKCIRAMQPEAKPVRVWDTEQPGLFLRIQPSGIKSFIVAYRADGKLTNHTLGRYGTLSLAQARDQARAALGKAATGTDPQAERKAKRKAAAATKREAERAKQQTLRVFMDERYEPWVRAHRKPSALLNLQQLRSEFASWLDKPMPSLTPWLVEKHRQQRLKAGAKPTTLNRYTAALKAVLSKAVDWEVIDVHPLAKVKPLKLDSKGKVRYLTEAEERRLRKALSDRETRIRTERASGNAWRAERGRELLPDLSAVAFVDHLQPIVLLAINTGLRRGELFNLAWADIDLRTRTLTVQGSGSKSGETRHVPLNDEAIDVLTRWKPQQTGDDEQDIGGRYVFPAADGGRLDNIKKSFGKLLADADIDGFRFHDLRHHFASRLVMAGVDLNTVRELLGHANLEMTLRYAHLAPEHKAAAVALLNQGAA